MADALVCYRDKVNYTDIKNKYMKHIEMYYSCRRLNMTCPFTRNIVNRIISVIKNGIALKARGHTSLHAKYNIMKKYEIVSEDGKEILVTKPNLAIEPVLKVIPAEDCFDIILEAHIKTNHGGRDTTLRCIEGNKYSVPKTSVEFILALCNKCQHGNSVNLRQKARKKVTRVFNARAQVCIIDMTDQYDHQFQYILFYLDRLTKFMVLRPLVSTSHEEVAMELLKIFFDYGPPEKVEAYNRSFFTKVLGLVKSFCEDFNVNSMLPTTMPEIGPQNIKSMLNKWQRESGSKNWAIGCYLLQWKNNCTVDLDGHSPYSCVFGVNPWNADPVNVFMDSGKPTETDPDEIMPDKSKTGSDDDFQIVVDFSDEKDAIIDINDDDADAMEEADMIIITEPPIMYVPLPSAPPPIQQEPTVKSKPAILRKTVSLSKSTKRKPINTVNTHKPGTAPQNPEAAVSKPTTNLDSAMAPTYIHAKTGEATNDKPVENRTVNTATKLECHVCKTEIAKPYKCTKCKRKVHLFCSDRLLQQGISQDVLDVICTSCKLVKSRYENLKRKFNSIVSSMD